MKFLGIDIGKLKSININLLNFNFSRTDNRKIIISGKNEKLLPKESFKLLKNTN